MSNVLIIPYKIEFAEYLKQELIIEGANLIFAVTLADVKGIFEENEIDILFMGTDAEHLSSRLQIIDYVMKSSIEAEEGPSIHMLGIGQDTFHVIKSILNADLL